MEITSPRRHRAGKINALRRWDPTSDELVTHDVDTICAIAARISRPLNDAELSRVLLALRKTPSTAAAVVGTCPHGAEVNDDAWTPCQRCAPIAS